MSTIETPVVTGIPQGTWTVDPAHSSVEFSVKHMGIATVRGQFASFEGALESDGENVSVSGTVDAASIDTHNEQRDQHLVSADFFEVEKHPQITFSADSVELNGDGTVRIPGRISIRGVEKEIELTGDYAGAGTDPWGNERVALEVSGEIDRREFGLVWNQPLAGGGLLVSNGVKLTLSVAAVKE